MITPRIVLLLAIFHTTRPQHARRPNRTLQFNDRWIPGDHIYEKVSLVEPKFKSKQRAGLEWYQTPEPESSGAQKRHLEWLESSGSDSESAGATDNNGLLAEVFGDEDDSKKEEETDLDLRQNRRKKYVEVNQFLLPLLMAYKLKFFTMIPILIGALVLLAGSTGLAGFFFALFAAAAGLHNMKTNHH